MAGRDGYNAPPGWSYNPSSWSERRPLLLLAAVGLAAAIYTACAQVGIIARMWDPFFGSQSSYLVTHSAISHLLPIPDGLLGMTGYLCDLTLGAVGASDRWRSLPGVVLLFGATITGLGVVSVALTILQGAVILHWCTVCLISAAVSILIWGLGIGEALPSLQYLARERVRGNALWPTLWGRQTHAARTRRGRTKRMVLENVNLTTEQSMDSRHIAAH